MSETMVETCVLTLGELIDKDLGNEKFKKFSDEMQTLLKGSEGSKYQLTIPFYQRTYVWSEDMVKIMLEDIDEQRKEGKKYLLGSLIIHIDGNEFNIVDGQQRLTTLDLVLGCGLLDKSNENISNEEKETKDNAQATIDAWFNSKNKDEFIDYLKNNIEFVCVFTDSIDDAFIFFDSANAKGIRLKAYDLIKAFHLRALETQNCEDLIKFYAKDFESFAKKIDNDDDDRDNENRPIKVLLNDILAPARIWLRDRGKLANATHKVITNQQEHYIYDEFCKEFSATLQTKPQRSTNSLGILQNFIGGADFFEFLAHFNRLYEKLLQTEFYDKKIANINETGFAYNRLIYIMAMLIYFDKFPNGNADYMLRLIARAIFSLRTEYFAITENIVKNYVRDKKILSLIYHTSIEQELESELLKFVSVRVEVENDIVEKIEQGKKKRAVNTDKYIRQMQKDKGNDGKAEYGRYGITPHPELTKGE